MMVVYVSYNWMGWPWAEAMALSWWARSGCLLGGVTMGGSQFSRGRGSSSTPARLRFSSAGFVDEEFSMRSVGRANCVVGNWLLL